MLRPLGPVSSLGDGDNFPTEVAYKGQDQLSAIQATGTMFPMDPGSNKPQTSAEILTTIDRTVGEKGQPKEHTITKAKETCPDTETIAKESHFGPEIKAREKKKTL